MVALQFELMEIKKNSATASLSGAPYATVIRTGGHDIIADEPADHGGLNKGPRPHDYILAALSSCTCITVRMYADRKGWDLQNVVADLQMERIVENGVQRTNIVQQLQFEGNLSAEQKERLLYISGKCPVHKTLSLSMQIENRLIQSS